MNQFLLIAIAAGIIAFVATPLTLVLARRLRFVATPQATRWHLAPVPLLGGLAIWLAFVISLLVFGEGTEFRELVAILLGVTLVAGLGLIDDRNGISVRTKSFGQLLAASIVVTGGLRTHLFDFLPLIDIALTLFWIIGITNAINFMDNMDGLAAGISAVASGSFLLLALLNGQVLVASLAAALLGACLGFLIYNFQPALTFMGDTGSLALGFALAVLGIKLNFPGLPTRLTWMVPVLVLAVPIFDVTLVAVSRKRRGVPVARGGVDHTSHRMARLGLSNRRVVLALYSLAMAFGLMAVLITQASVLIANLVAIGLGVVGVFALYVMEHIGALPATTAVKPDMRITVIGGGRAMLPMLSATVRLTEDVTLVLAPLSQPQNDVAQADTLQHTVREITPDTLRAVWPVLASHPAAVERIVQHNLQLFDGGGLAERVNFAVLGLQLHGQVVVCDSGANSAAPIANPAVLKAIEAADLIVLGGDLYENTLAVLQIPAVTEALRRAKRPRVLIHADPRAALAMLQTAGVADVVTHAIATKATVGPWVTVSDLTRSDSLADAMASIWLERTHVRGALPALTGLLND